MWLRWTSCLGVVLFVLSMTGCSRADDNPPAASYRVDNFAYNSDGSSQTIRGAYVTPAFFQAVKARPLLGRVFLSEEYQSGEGQWLYFVIGSGSGDSER